MVAELKSDSYEWVELSHEVSPQTPHWVGFDPLTIEGTPLDMHTDMADVLAIQYSIVSQYGTHIDCPHHFVKDGRTLEKMPTKDLMFPLCVIDCHEKVAANPDYQLTLEDVKAYEAKYGPIPKNAFVAMRSDWSVTHADDYENNDKDGNPHYPGWDINALKYLFEEVGIGAVGHEPTDTDAPAAGLGWLCETYVLKQDKFQIEVMKNLDKVPEAGAMLLCSWPRITGGVGFSARCVAIFEKQ